MKRIILAVAFSAFLTPHLAKAWDNDDHRHHHRTISATETTGIGLAASAALGIAGYLALRRRKQA